MTGAFSNLSDADLDALIAGLRSRRIASPFSELQLSRILSCGLAKLVAGEFAELEAHGFQPEQIALTLELLANDRQTAKVSAVPIDLVTSGPEAPGITNRDTSVVVRELFAHANKSVLVVGYAVFQGQRVFQALAQRMEELPELHVQLFLNIPRPDRDTTAPEILISRFVHRFKDTQWPTGCRLPEVYFDPRSVSADEPIRSSLHAKCVVVDAEQVFVSSANFTEAAQERNIEVGLNIRNQWLANRITTHFQQLYSHQLVARAI